MPQSTRTAASVAEREAGHVSDNSRVLLRLIREARVRIDGALRRAVEIKELKRKYVVQWNFGGKTRNSPPAASAWLYVRCTIPGGVVVEMRVAPDYPQPYTRVRVVQVVGVMGWSRQDEKALEAIAQSVQTTSVATMMARIDAAVRAKSPPAFRAPSKE